MVIGYFINVMTARMTGGWIYRILVAPGVIVHEFSHALGCLITGTKIQSINVFKCDGGELKHTGSPIPIVGNVVISLMPIAVGIGILYFLPKLPILENWSNLTYWTNWSNFLNWQFWVFLYLIFNLVTTMAPSKQDIKVIWWDLLVLTGIFYLLAKFGLILNLIAVLPFLILSLIYSIIVLIIVGIIYFLSKLL